MLATLVTAVLLVLAIVAGWALLSRRRPSASRRLDGWARVENDCGSTLEIGLGIRDDRVERTLFRAEGCGYHCTCVDAATRLAKGKPVHAVFDIDGDAILRAVGDIPPDHRHCADMAARTLHAASRNYLEKCRATATDAVPRATERKKGREDA